MNQSASTHSKRGIVLALSFLVLLLIGGVFFVWSYGQWNQGKIMPGVRMGTRDVGAVSPEYVADLIDAYKERLRLRGVIFSFKGKQITLYSLPTPLNSDVPIQAGNLLFDIDRDGTTAALMTQGRRGSYLEQQVNRFRIGLTGVSIAPRITIDRKRIIEQLKKEYAFFHTPAKDAQFAIDDRGAITIIPEARGIEFDYDKALVTLQSQIASLQPPTIMLEEGSTLPAFTTEDLRAVSARTEQLVTQPLTISFDDTTSTPPKKRTWTLSRQLLLSWLQPQRNDSGQITIAFDRTAINDYLEKTIAPDIRIDVVHPRFEMKDGRVVAFDVPHEGRELDRIKTVGLLVTSLSDRTVPATLALRAVQSPFREITDTEPVVKELLAHAETDFSGSSSNRRKNIARGAELINGILLAPGEEFSTNKALGDVDAEHGFTEGLVIKGTETVPEYGGGLCQVSTTLFRAVAQAGLEVIERRNHSYRVSYYEPPVGFDATIYGTSPDFRFKNDTPSYLLVQARVTGNKMIVELWGTKDGRTVEIDTPRVFNIKKAGETKLIETDELPPGKKKCTEKAHNGADAVFERRITYADGTTKKETYKSRYVVWPAVCLIGKAKEPIPVSDTQNNPATGQQELKQESPPVPQN